MAPSKEQARRRAGRPSNSPVCNKEDVAKAILKFKGKLFLAAQHLKITRETLTTYFKRWPELREVVREAKGLLIDHVEDRLDKAVNRDEPWAIQFFLRHRAKGRGYGDLQRLAIGGDKNAPPVKTQQGQAISIEDLGLPADVLRLILDKAREKEAERERVSSQSKGATGNGD